MASAPITSAAMRHARTKARRRGSRALAATHAAADAEGSAYPHPAQFWLNGQLALDLYRVSHDDEGVRHLERIEPVSS